MKQRIINMVLQTSYTVSGEAFSKSNVRQSNVLAHSRILIVAVTVEEVLLLLWSRWSPLNGHYPPSFSTQYSDTATSTTITKEIRSLKKAIKQCITKSCDIVNILVTLMISIMFNTFNVFAEPLQRMTITTPSSNSRCPKTLLVTITWLW